MPYCIDLTTDLPSIKDRVTGTHVAGKVSVRFSHITSHTGNNSTHHITGQAQWDIEVGGKTYPNVPVC